MEPPAKRKRLVKVAGEADQVREMLDALPDAAFHKIQNPCAAAGETIEFPHEPLRPLCGRNSAALARAVSAHVPAWNLPSTEPLHSLGWAVLYPLGETVGVLVVNAEEDGQYVVRTHAYLRTWAQLASVTQATRITDGRPPLA